MSHEPECEGPYLAADCTDCRIARAAYQRGRKDAANAVNELYTVKVVDEGMADLLEAAIAAAASRK